MRNPDNNVVSRRQALRRLGLGVATAYFAPSLTTLSMARANSNPSEPSEPTAPSTSSAPSGSFDSSGDNTGNTSSPSNAEAASCRNRTVNTNTSFSISRKDYDAAQAAVQSGQALPLEAVWPDIASQYNGRLVGIKFFGSGTNAQYQFRAISASGRLETIVVHASTGIIDSIVGC